MPADFHLTNYLNRIEYNGPLEPTLSVLASLQSAHVNAIPFEGIDRLMRIPVALELDLVQKKIVNGRRGGNCFEQNLLLQAALEQIGFNVRGLGGRVRWNSPADSPMEPRAHMLLLVDLPEGQQIVDVGFGACMIDAPLSFDVGADQSTPTGTYRLDNENGLYFLMAKQPAGWRTMYAFGVELHFLSDYVMANAYAPINPQIPFLSNLVAQRVANGVRFKLINRKLLVESRDGELMEERLIHSAQELGHVLENNFNLLSPVPLEELFSRVPS